MEGKERGKEGKMEEGRGWENVAESCQGKCGKAYVALRIIVREFGSRSCPGLRVP